MNEKAKRIHSIKRLVWLLGIVNVVALLLLFSLYGVMTGKSEASIVEVRPEVEVTENGRHLLLAYDRLSERYGQATMWTCVLLLVQLVIFAMVDGRLAKQLPLQMEQAKADTPSDQ